MDKLRLRYFILLLVLPLFLVSCSDDDDDEPNVSPNVGFLTAGEWTGNAVFVGGVDRTEDFETQTGITLSEYTTLFNSNGTYSESYQGTEMIDGNWEFQDNERTIQFEENGGDTYTVSVTRLDDDELFYIQDGIEYRFIR